MIYWLDEPRRLQEVAVRRVFRVTLAVSLLVHLIALSVVLKRTHLLSWDEGLDKKQDRLEVRLTAAAPPQTAPTAVLQPSRVQQPKPSPPARPIVRTPRPPPVIASPAPALPIPQQPAPAPPTPPAPQRAQSQPAENDLWSYIQARRRERGLPEDSLVASHGTERNADLAANLPRPATGRATEDTNHGGGIFEIKRMTYDDAAFLFFGWNPEMGRQTPQLITVRLGDNPNMRIAVVRKMIAIIRDYTQADFVWRSPHNEGGVTLSARPADNAELESYLMHEFSRDFDENGAPH